MTTSEDHAGQAHHGTLQKQLHLRSLVLFGLAYMTPIIVLGIFGVIAELSDGGSAGSYLFATVAIRYEPALPPTDSSAITPKMPRTMIGVM